MVRGKKIFKCDKCGKVFIAPDIEFCATILSQPMPCPKCGSCHTYPYNPFDLLKTQRKAYEAIWKQMEQE